MKAKITSLDPPQVTAEVEKPKELKYGYTGDEYYTYQSLMREYKQSQIPIDIQNSMHIHNCRYVMQDGEYKRLELNQSVQIVRTEKGCRITKI